MTPKLNGGEACDACGAVLLIALIAGCYAAGLGASGWFALGLGLNVWLLGYLGITYANKKGGPKP